MKIKILLNHVLVFIAWLINSALALWVMLVGRQSLLATLGVFYVGDSYPRAWRARWSATFAALVDIFSKSESWWMEQRS